ncbi:autotransporter outer membrane beta-barrel domain-containing protein [Pseudomonas sp. PB103]|uniref:autotransporter family protein n=1 Tax=Pseudomonas sp. PB103 TaxID=2494698 RepID=UPI00131BF542|nr:autotransporter outer membrane beta-barrel domain-containing protein [Pseudomonas sp. PB103]KAE9638295.1 autotransporter outer membrane beta-barrel domain-containing protein [Pseudomonas sp. PB103]
MSVQHIFRPKQLALAIALTIGCTEIAVAQQPETPVVAEADIPKTPAKKPVPKAASSDDIFASKVFIGPKKNAPSRAKKPEKELPGDLPLLSTNLPVEFDQAFYEFLEFPEIETVDVKANGNPFDDFQNALSTTHTRLSTAPEILNGVSLQLGEGDDLLEITSAASLEGRIDGGAGKNGLLLNAAEGGKIADAANFQHLRVARGEWHLHQELAGDADVQAGVLLNNSWIKGNVHVGSNAVYGGYGNAGNVTVEGSLIANTVRGSPTIKGNLTFAEGATFSYGVTANEFADPVFVNGTAQLAGANFEVYGAPGDYAQTTSTTVLYAGKVEGEFDKVTTNLAFMTPTLRYDENQVDLTFSRNGVKVESVATSENALEIAKEIDQTPGISTVPVKPPATVLSVAESAGTQTGSSIDRSTSASSIAAITAVAEGASKSSATQTPAVAATPGATTAPAKASPPPAPANKALVSLLGSNRTTAALALEQLAAGSNANLAKATLSAVTPVNDSLLSAMRQLDPGKPSTRANDGNGRVWVQALGNSGKIDRDTDSTLKHATQGLVAGADWRLDEQWHVGIIGGKSQTKLDARHSDGDLDSWHLGAYAVRQDGPLALRFGATYASHDGSSKRRVAFNGFSDRLKGSYDASTQQAFAEAGYNFGEGDITLEPFANLGYQRYQRDSYSEKGGDAALKVHGQSQNNLTSTFGLRVAKTNTLDNGMHLTPRLSAGWKHTYGELDLHTRQQLLNGGIDFEIAGAQLDRNSLSVDAGLDLALSANHTLGVGVTGDVASDSRNTGVMGQWRMAF